MIPCGMKQDDARKLDHATLEAMRIRAVRSVQAGENPEVVARSLRISRRTIYGWLAQYRRGRMVDVGLHHRGVQAHSPPVRHLFVLRDLPHPFVNLLDHLRPQRQAASGPWSWRRASSRRPPG